MTCRALPATAISDLSLVNSSPQPATISSFPPSESSATNDPNPFERLAQLVLANDRLFDELATSRARIVSALTYLDQPGCHFRFGSAHLERCRTRHAGILAQLKANRLEALDLLGDPSKTTD